MEDLTLIQKLVIPEYPTRIKTSDSQRRKYYRKRVKKRGKGKGNKLIWKPRGLPKTYRESLETGDWTIDSKGYLRDENGNRIVANPRSAGEPNYEPISGNRFVSGMHHHLRMTIIEGLKDEFRPHVQRMDEFTRFPIIVEWDLYTKVREPNFDLSNFWFYYKYVEDTMVDEGILPDDKVSYITKPAAPLLFPIQSWNDRKFVFYFYLDEREIITGNKIWNN